MKKTILLSLSLFGASFVAQGAFVTCNISPTQIPNGVGAAALSCPGLDAGAGNTLGGVQLLLAGDYINGPSGTTTGTQVHEIYTPTATFGVHTEDIFGGFSSSSSTTDGNPNGGGGPFLAETVVINSQTLAGFTINVVSSVPAGGPVNASTINAFLQYTPVVPTGGVPEPATAGLIGGALLGLGFIARRRKKN